MRRMLLLMAMMMSSVPGGVVLELCISVDVSAFKDSLFFHTLLNTLLTLVPQNQ